ncbi:MAG: TIGR02646 family protein [Candidatus Aminicenantes bacterium]|nr:TIGR02646 family protein [Candidatus Aminicenantes bacterium]
MKYIKKRREPKSLKHYRSIPGAYFDGIKDKSELLQALLEEQHFICCYCMQGITAEPGKAHIEHWKPQSLYPGLQLNYRNLLAVCDGNEGNPKHLPHCDRSKGDKEISIDPTNPNCETLIKFRSSGEVDSDNKKVEQELNSVLNLNQQTLSENRKIALDIAIRNLLAVKPEGKWPKNLLEKEILKWECRGKDGKYKPFCGAVICYLKERLSRYS